MYKYLILLLFLPSIKNIHAQQHFNSYPVYEGNDLGIHYTKAHTQFKIWSPTAEAAELRLYTTGVGNSPVEIIALNKGISGTWTTTVHKNLKGTFYTFRIKTNGIWKEEVPDPYAKAVGTNGVRAMVFDPSDTDPENWEKDKRPSYTKSNQPTDAIIYELHIRDASIDPQSGITHKGKYLGLAETGTKTKTGTSTGLQHLKDLGVTHIHLLPFFDYNSVDESKPEQAQYNWGYDPLHYNVPEGSYSTNATDGITRIKELKTMIAAMHKNGLRVVMDVVYNHTGITNGSNFNQLVPGYYYRLKSDGSFSDASACGNETASDHPMMRKFMLESLVYWVKEYHIDGFRFDLMGIHDIETMNLISDTLHQLLPDILLYGEGWTAGASPLPETKRAIKKNASQLKGIAVFSDDIRDGIKGSVFDEKDKGFVSGNLKNTESVKFGIVAACEHPQVDMSKVNYSKQPYALQPSSVISYCECHDNHTLADKIKLSATNVHDSTRKQMHLLALTIVLTSQGIPFLHAGTEFMRHKYGVENSYNKPDSINAIHWAMKKQHEDVLVYVQSLIALKKKHPAFRLTSAASIRKNISFLNDLPEGIIAYTIDGAAAGDSWKKILVVLNGGENLQQISLPSGKWRTGLKSNPSNLLQSGKLQIKGYSASVLYQP